MSQSSYPEPVISSCISAFSPAPQCQHLLMLPHHGCFHSIKLFCSLKWASQPLLNLSSSGIPAKSANMFHFHERTMPVSKIPSPIAFETYRSIILVTSGCLVCQVHLVVWSLWLPLGSHSVHHFASLTHDEIKGCLIGHLGRVVHNASPFHSDSSHLWYQLRISMH
jgi:hypothetical protein